MKKPKSYNVIKANYINGYCLEITFEDGHKVIVDFNDVILKYAVGDYAKYKKIANFKRFKIDHGNLVWGKDYDLFFPPERLYTGKIQ